jgi:GTP-binding protein YchF
MGFKCGIVGLPNVGKSTLFNALTQTAAAQAANYPFCTIEPNVGDVAVPDERLTKLAGIAKSAQIIPTRLTFVDIAGLVKGASKGEGLGNQFLANIREVDAIAHVVRCFEDGDITHVDGRIDPLADIETIETELMLADMESLEKRIAGVEKKAKSGEKQAKAEYEFMMRPLELLREGRPARELEVADDELKEFRMLGLLTSKPVLYVCNVEEEAADQGNAFSDKVKEFAASQGAEAVVVSAKIESEIAVLDDDEQRDYLEAIGLAEPGLNRVIRAGYRLLKLLTYFTVGPKEARAWTMTTGTRAPPQPVSFTPTSKRASSAPKPLPTMTSCLWAARRARVMPARCGWKARNTLSLDGDVMHFRFNT